MNHQIAVVRVARSILGNPGYLPVEFDDSVAGDTLVGRIEKHIFQFKRV